MQNKEELDKAGVKYSRFRYRFLPKDYKVETREFDPEDRIMTMPYSDYVTLMAVKLNNENIKDGVYKEQYIPIYKTKGTHILCTIIKLED